MTSSKFDFANLISLLGRSENDAELAGFLGSAIAKIKRDEYYGSLQFRPEGVGMVFQEAPWVIPPERVRDPRELHVAAFHLHRNGHEGYDGYTGHLPNGLGMGDCEDDVIRKMGPPLKVGGGGTSHATKGLIPRWFWYAFGEAILHIQFDQDGRIEMITPRVREVKMREKKAKGN